MYTITRGARRLLVAAAGLATVATLLWVGCGSNNSTSPEQPTPFTGTIHVQDDRFSPAAVTITVGDSVTWRWEGTHAHSVTQGTTPDAAEDSLRLFDSGIKTHGHIRLAVHGPRARSLLLPASFLDRDEGNDHGQDAMIIAATGLGRPPAGQPRTRQWIIDAMT